MSPIFASLQTNFETIKKTQQELEYWSARELMPLLGYKERRKFVGVIEKAKVACEISGQQVSDHFVGSANMVQLGSGSQRSLDDCLLTRYACYLIAQNGDSRKQEIAFAQTYFAIQTRKQELAEQQSMDEKRLEAREKLKISEEKIEETVYHRGITLPKEFATFKNKKIEALYGMSTKALKKKRDIPEYRALADFDSEVELKAKDFIYAMTDHNIKEKDIVGKPNLENELVANTKTTRKALLERGIRPETLPKQTDLKHIEKKRDKLLSKKSPLN